MTLSLVLPIHICAAAVGLLAGGMAMVFRKGSGWHGAAGNVFFVSMLVAAASSAYLAAFLKPVALNVVTSSLEFYLVATGWREARRLKLRATAFDGGALLFVLGVGLYGVACGIEAAGSRNGMKDRVPALGYFVFSTIVLLFAFSDVRMLVRRGVTAAQRISRHLWRMSLALLLALLSFYPGQAKIFPANIRRNGLFYVPHLLLLAAMIYWRRRASRRSHTIAACTTPTSTGSSSLPSTKTSPTLPARPYSPPPIEVRPSS